MAHLSGPHSWTPGGILRWVASSITLLGLGTWAEENIRHFVEERHWNEFLTSAVKAMPDLSPIIGTHWFWFCFGLSVGITVALWVAKRYPESANIVREPKTIVPGNIVEQPYPQDINPLETYFLKKIIRIVDLIHKTGYVVDDKVFEDCVLYGPGVICLLDKNTLDACALDGSIDITFIEIDENRLLLGVIGFRRCTFRSCKFVSIGIVATKDDIESFKAQLRVS